MLSLRRRKKTMSPGPPRGLLFKPVWIDAGTSDPVLGKLRGYWVDGGVLNNIPLGSLQADAYDSFSALFEDGDLLSQFSTVLS